MTPLNKHVSIFLLEETDRIVDIITSTESVKQTYGLAIFCLSNTEKVGAACHISALHRCSWSDAAACKEESSVQCRNDSVKITLIMMMMMTITPWSGVLPMKLVLSQLLTKFTAYM
jgi:hypothetical protein